MQRRTRGTAYVLATGLSLLMIVGGFGALLAARALVHSGVDRVAVLRAEMAARDGLTWALVRLEASPDAADGTLSAPITLSRSSGTTSIDVSIRASTRTIAADAMRPVLIDVEAVVDGATRTMSGEAVFARRPYSGLAAPIAVGGTLEVASGGELSVKGRPGYAGIAVVADPDNLDGTIVEARATSATLHAVLERAAALREIPTAGQLATMRSAGTVLSVAGTGDILLERMLFSPRHTPYGTTLSPAGVYVIECAGRRVVVRSTRVLGTLVLVDPGPGSIVEGSSVFEPSIRGYPSLVVLGSIELSLSTTLLSENESPRRDFNPQGAPYPAVGGTFDEDRVDLFPPRIDGAVVVTGNAIVDGDTDVKGLLVGGNLLVEGRLVVQVDEWSAWSPGPGLRAARWRWSPGSIRIGEARDAAPPSR
jgi:hypothetical protein